MGEGGAAVVSLSGADGSGRGREMVEGGGEAISDTFSRDVVNSASANIYGANNKTIGGRLLHYKEVIGIFPWYWNYFFIFIFLHYFISSSFIYYSFLRTAVCSAETSLSDGEEGKRAMPDSNHRTLMGSVESVKLSQLQGRRLYPLGHGSGQHFEYYFYL